METTNNTTINITTDFRMKVYRYGKLWFSRRRVWCDEKRDFVCLKVK